MSILHRPAIEDAPTSKDASALDDRSCDFPFEEIFARMDGDEPEPDHEKRDALLALTITRTLEFIIGPQGEAPKARAIGARALTLQKLLAKCDAPHRV